jgi:homopolymeric O-antigen transport system ATP-binding protein
MTDIVIKAENLGKKYMIGHQAERGRYVALRDVLMHGARTLWNKTKDLAKGKSIIQGDTLEEVWALKDVSFEIKRGEAVGIIGRNGAGKSTLLKVLSRITEPSAGRVTIKGRVASLLEVGTGFHPELTGRENIYLNGTILGMARKEVKHKFDEIVAFAEMEKFIDTPVKHYSSGMYMRLAFAVAAHLEPEILLVDEVLAVGDAAFQKKCLGKMGEVSKEGRTVLFVSHNMGAIGDLCEKAILLDKGLIVYCGNVNEGINLYTEITYQRLGLTQDLRNWKLRSGSQRAKIFQAKLSWIAQQEPFAFPAIGDTLIFQFDIEREPDVDPQDIRLSISIKTITGTKVLHVTNEDDNFIFPNAPEATITVKLPNLLLYPGSYTVSLWVGSKLYNDYDYIQDCIGFNVIQGNVLPRSFKMDWSQGLVFHPSQWSVNDSSVC